MRIAKAIRIFYSAATIRRFTFTPPLLLQYVLIFITYHQSLAPPGFKQITQPDNRGQKHQ